MKTSRRTRILRGSAGWIGASLLSLPPALAAWEAPCGRGFVLRVENDGAARLQASSGDAVLELPGWRVETSGGARELRACAAQVDVRSHGDSTVVTIAAAADSLAATLRYICLPAQEALRIDLRVTYAAPVALVSGGLEVAFAPSLELLAGPRAVAAGDAACNQQQTRFTQRELLARAPSGEAVLRVHGRHAGARGVELLADNAWLFYDGEAHCTRLTRPTYEDRRDHCHTRRAPGESDSLTVVVNLAAEGPSLGLNTFPGACPAALTIVDDADGEGRELLLAVYFGASDPTHADFGHHGLLGHGLRITRTIFAESRLQDVWDRLYTAGTEIALHTPSRAADSADAVARCLPDLMSRYGLRHWVDHAVGTNPEDLNYRGSYPRDDNPFYILDRLESAGCEYAWVEHNMFRGFDAFTDRRELPHTLDALDDPDVPGRLWVYGRGGGVFFENYSGCLKETVTTEALDELVRRAGLAILYTHTCVLGYEGQSVGYLRQEGSTWVVKPAADALFAMLAARAATGELWIAPAGEVFDRLRAMEGLQLGRAEPLAGGGRRWRLYNASDRTLLDVGLRFRDCGAVSVDGLPAAPDGDGWLILPRVEPGREYPLEAAAAAPAGPGWPRIRACPNPSHGDVLLKCASPNAPPSEMRVHDCGGRLVWQGLPAPVSANEWALAWTGRDERGARVSAGLYWVSWRRPAGAGAAPILLVR